jgi:molybdate transport system regulatory protein
VNQLNGVVTQIQQSGSIVLADVDSEGHTFSALVIYSQKLPVWLYIGNTVSVIFKETEVSLAQGLFGVISMRNQLTCEVKNIKRGELLSVIEMLFGKRKITSVITTRSLDMLMLKTGSRVTALIKANEITLAELTW